MNLRSRRWRSRCRFVGVVGGILFLSSCQRSDAPTELFLTRTNGWFAHWFATGAGDSVASIFRPHGVWRSPHGPDIEGAEAIAGRVDDLHQLQGVLVYSMEGFDRTDSILEEHGRYRFTFVAPQTGVVLEDWGRYTARWEQTERTWKLAEHVDRSERPSP